MTVDNDLLNNAALKLVAALSAYRKAFMKLNALNPNEDIRAELNRILDRIETQIPEERPQLINFPGRNQSLNKKHDQWAKLNAELLPTNTEALEQVIALINAKGVLPAQNFFASDVVSDFITRKVNSSEYASVAPLQITLEAANLEYKAAVDLISSLADNRVGGAAILQNGAPGVFKELFSLRPRS